VGALSKPAVVSFILDDGLDRRVTWGYVDSLMPFSDADACDLDRCLDLPSPVYLMRSAHCQLPYTPFCYGLVDLYHRSDHAHTHMADKAPVKEPKDTFENDYQFEI
jgi:hypothetical protein